MYNGQCEGLMTDPIKISFCTTCKGRLHHLKETLPKNLSDNADYPHVEFVILDYGCPDGTAKWVKDTFPEEIKSGKILVAEFPSANGFYYPHAKNIAHRIAAEQGKFQGDPSHILCNVDADNSTGKGFATYIAQYFNGGAGTFLCNDAATKRVFRLEDKGVTHPRGRGCGGRIAVRKEDFYSIRGYDESFTKGWGPDDTYLVRRLMRRLICIPDIIPTHFLDSIPHENDERVKFAPDADALEQTKGFMARYANPATLGKIGGLIKRELSYLNSLSATSSHKDFGCGDVTIDKATISLVPLSRDLFSSRSRQPGVSIAR